MLQFCNIDACNRLLFSRIDTLIITTVKRGEKCCQTMQRFMAAAAIMASRSERHSRTMAPAVSARESDYDFSKTLSIEQTHAQLFPVSMFGWENTFFAFIFPAPLIRLADFPTYGFCAIFLFVFVGRIFH